LAQVYYWLDVFISSVKALRGTQRPTPTRENRLVETCLAKVLLPILG